MSYRFRLEKVLRLRRRTAEQRAREVKRAAGALARREARVQALRQALTSVVGDPETAGSPQAILRWAQRAAWLQRRRRDLRQLRVERDAAATKLSRARERLVAAHRAVEVLERLRRRQEDAWRAQERRREGKQYDEIAAIRAERQRRVDLA